MSCHAMLQMDHHHCAPDESVGAPSPSQYIPQSAATKCAVSVLTDDSSEATREFCGNASSLSPVLITAVLQPTLLYKWLTPTLCWGNCL